MEVAITRGFRDVMKEKPLFPSYLFCRFDAESSLAYVRWTKGVVKILPESIAPTDQIRITRGSMKDILGIFDYWTSDEGRVRVLLNFLNYQAAVELHHSFIEKVAQ
jgi:transcription antitermination factor NusG